MLPQPWSLLAHFSTQSTLPGYCHRKEILIYHRLLWIKAGKINFSVFWLGWLSILGVVMSALAFGEGFLKERLYFFFRASGEISLVLCLMLLCWMHEVVQHIHTKLVCFPNICSLFPGSYAKQRKQVWANNDVLYPLYPVISSFLTIVLWRWEVGRLEATPGCHAV